MARKPCPTCNGFAEPGRPRCAACTARQRKASRLRNPRTDQHYSTTTWRTTRAAHLAQHPDCQHPGCTRTATDVDHVIPRRILTAAGIRNPDHPRWLQSLCHPHHSSKTLTIDKSLLERLANGEDPVALAETATQRDNPQAHPQG